MFRLPSKELIEAFAREGGTVYSYLFTLEFPYKYGKTAYRKRIDSERLPEVWRNQWGWKNAAYKAGISVISVYL